MNSWVGLIQHALFFGFIVVVLSASATTAGYPLVKNKLYRLSAETQASVLLGLTALPVLMTFAVLLSALLPSLLQLVGFGTDHCLGHTEGHQHFCLIHRPQALNSPPLIVMGVLFLALFVLIARRLAVDIHRTRNFQGMLSAFGRVSIEGPVHTLATNVPLAFSSGILRPRIFVSTALLDSLTEDEKRLVLAHEYAHIDRHDGLRLLIARAFSLAHLPATRKALLAHLQLASEQVCDAVAARQAHDPGNVAELLLKIEKLYRRHFPSQAPLAFNLLGESESTLPGRIEALLAPSVIARLPWAPAASVLAVMLLLLIGHDLLHDWLEHASNLFTQG
jgi:Zn-dependent protease with chaperone function